MWSAQRIGPIIVPEMDWTIGNNIQGPSAVRMPSWASGRSLGAYFLYFSDHLGSYIRLAYADAIDGPWRVHVPAALDLAESGFPTFKQGTPAHIASPDVHVDEANRRIVMYFHGICVNGSQFTRACISADGLNFVSQRELLGPPYFRVFQHSGFTYALAMPGIVFRSVDGLRNFERGPLLFSGDLQRHTAVLCRGDILHVFWSRVGDTPERILHSTVDMRGDWLTWKACGEDEVLRPEFPYEGSDLPLLPSRRGPAKTRLRELRDPAIFEEGARLFLLYTLAGEAGIGLAKLVSKR